MIYFGCQSTNEYNGNIIQQKLKERINQLHIPMKVSFRIPLNPILLPGFYSWYISVGKNVFPDHNCHIFGILACYIQSPE